MSVPIQYYDINGNAVPVYITRRVKTYDKWTANSGHYTIEVERTWEVDSNCYIQVRWGGWEPGDYWNGAGYNTMINFLFKANNTRKYLRIHDVVKVKSDELIPITNDTYTYDYTYYSDLNWNDIVYGRNYMMINSDQNEVYYFPVESYYPLCTFPPDYLTDRYGNPVYMKWVIDHSVVNPVKAGESVTAYGFRPGSTYDSYMGFEPIRGDVTGDKFIVPELDSQGQETGSYLPAIPLGGTFLSPWGNYQGWSGYGWQNVINADTDQRVEIEYRNGWQWQTHNQTWFWGGDVVIGPGGYGLYNIYLPSRIDIDDLNAALWAANWSSSFYKLFSDPMETVVSFHAIYAPLQYDSRDVIHFGNVVGNGSRSFPISLRTSHAIQSVPCGSVTVDEYFQNAMDYAPYTDWEIYLPYIGFRPLRADEITGGTITVAYKVDITTGGCVATLTIQKSGGSIIMYTYSGNCAIQLPLSSADYSRRVTGVISAGLSIGSAVMTGGATAPLAAGAVGSAVMNSKAHVERSGSLSGNVGCLGPSKPYLVATRPVPAVPTNFNEFYGYPASQYALLSNCSGYTRVKEVHLDSLTCSEREKLEIERLLKTGVFI